MNTENFTGKAAIETIFGFAQSDTVFADIGAGAGRFTVKLAERGYSKFAVELNAAFDRDSVDGLLHCGRVTKVYSERIE